MKHARYVTPLVAIALLLGVLVLQRGSPVAFAQAQANRLRGEYTLISGRLANGGAHAIYVLDSSNGEMIALRWDQSRQVMTGIGYRSLSKDANAQIGR